MINMSGLRPRAAFLLSFLLVSVGLYTMKVQTLLPLALSSAFYHAGTTHAQTVDASGKEETADQLRLNQIQVIGTHNSYHREISLNERKVLESYIPSSQDLYYSHSSLSDQLTHQQVRSFELDLHSDERGGLYANPLIWKLSNLTSATAPFNNSVLLRPGLKVFHITDVDTNSICHTFASCLREALTWSDAHPNHLPLTFDLELKTDALAASLGGVSDEEASNFTLPRILNVDKEILSVIPREKVITPDDVRREGMSLEESVLRYGWPTLSDSRGKFLFFFDNDPLSNSSSSSSSDIRSLYRSNSHESLQNRTVFTNAVEGDEDCAFIKYNNPDIMEIQRLVKKGYLVRTRADEPISTVLSRNTTMRENALASGAQIVSTDFPAYGMSARWARDYAVQFSRGRVARCNHVSAPGWCRDEMVQD